MTEHSTVFSTGDPPPRRTDAIAHPLERGELRTTRSRLRSAAVHPAGSRRDRHRNLYGNRDDLPTLKASFDPRQRTGP